MTRSNTTSSTEISVASVSCWSIGRLSELFAAAKDDVAVEGAPCCVDMAGGADVVMVEAVATRETACAVLAVWVLVAAFKDAHLAGGAMLAAFAEQMSLSGVREWGGDDNALGMDGLAIAAAARCMDSTPPTLIAALFGTTLLTRLLIACSSKVMGRVATEVVLIP